MSDKTAPHGSLAAALAAFQASLPAVHKGAQGQVPGKREHRYADLADLSAVVLPALGAQGLSWMTMPTVDEHGRFVLRYELLHTSGESRTGDYPLSGNTALEQASSQTYARRYCLSAVTGVAADDDDDGAAANQAAPTRSSKPRASDRQSEDTVQAARTVLANRAKALGVGLDIVDGEYQKRAGRSVREETDPKTIRAFIAGLDDGTVTIPASAS